MKIKEVIVVEGKNDANTLKSFLDCDTIITNGSNISNKTLATLKQIQKSRGIIVFTDPDTPGEKIRNKINEAIPQVKNAFIMKEKARTSKKVGVEHASKEDVMESLSNLMTYEKESVETLSFDEFNALGFNGRKDSSALREKVGEALFIGKCNAKTLYKRLNMLKLNKEQVKKVIEEIYE